MYKVTFQNLLQSPLAYALYSGGAYEPTQIARRVVDEEASRRSEATGLEVEDCKAAAWSEFYNSLNRTVGFKSSH